MLLLKCRSFQGPFCLALNLAAEDEKCVYASKSPLQRHVARCRLTQFQQSKVTLGKNAARQVRRSRLIPPDEALMRQTTLIRVRGFSFLVVYLRLGVIV